MATSFSKETKPTTSFTKELKPGNGATYFLVWDEVTTQWQDNSETWDDVTGLVPSTPYTKEGKPTTAFNKEGKP